MESKKRLNALKNLGKLKSNKNNPKIEGNESEPMNTHSSGKDQMISKPSSKNNPSVKSILNNKNRYINNPPPSNDEQSFISKQQSFVQSSNSESLLNELDKKKPDNKDNKGASKKKVEFVNPKEPFKKNKSMLVPAAATEAAISNTNKASSNDEYPNQRPDKPSSILKSDEKDGDKRKTRDDEGVSVPDSLKRDTKRKTSDDEGVTVPEPFKKDSNRIDSIKPIFENIRKHSKSPEKDDELKNGKVTPDQDQSFQKKKNYKKSQKSPNSRYEKVAKGLSPKNNFKKDPLTKEPNKNEISPKKRQQSSNTRYEEVPKEQSQKNDFKKGLLNKNPDNFNNNAKDPNNNIEISSITPHINNDPDNDFKKIDNKYKNTMSPSNTNNRSGIRGDDKINEHIKKISENLNTPNKDKNLNKKVKPVNNFVNPFFPVDSTRDQQLPVKDSNDLSDKDNLVNLLDSDAMNTPFPENKYKNNSRNKNKDDNGKYVLKNF